MSSSSSASKKVQNKKASTTRRGVTILPPSPYRVVTSSGVITSPGQTTIIESWQYEKEKKEKLAEWHLLVRQRIIGLVTTLPTQLSGEELQKLDLPRLSADDLGKLTSHKLAAIAAKLITVESPHGPNLTEPVDSLLAELDHNAATPYVKSSIRRAVNARQTQVDKEALDAAMQNSVVNNPTAEEGDDQVPTAKATALVTFAQSSASAMASFKNPRHAPPLKMVETEASKQRKTYAEATVSSASSQRQYALSTLAVETALVDQPDRQPHQRQVVKTKHLGAFVGHEALTVRMTSKRKAEPKPTADSRATTILAPTAGGRSAANTAGVSLTNHFDRFVASRQQAVTGVAASAGKDAPAIPVASASQQTTVAVLTSVSASQQSAVATLLAVPASRQSAVATQQSATATLSAVPAPQQSAVAILPKQPALSPTDTTRAIPNSLLLSVSDDDDGYGDSQPPYVPDVGSKTPSPLPVPDMNASSDDDIGNKSYDDESGDDETNDDNHPTDDKSHGDVDAPPEDPDDPIQLTLGPAAMVPYELSGHLSESLESCFNIQVGAPATYLPPGFTENGVREGP